MIIGMSNFKGNNTDAAAHRLAQACSICYMLGNPADLKAGAVVQPVVGPVVEGSEVYVRRQVVCQKVLPFIVCPPAGSCQSCNVACASSFGTWMRQIETERQSSHG